MRRIKLVLAVAAAVTLLTMVGAAPATADDFFDGFRCCHHQNFGREDVDIDQFSVGAFDCFAVFERERRDVDLQDAFCFPPNGGAPIEVV